MQSSVAIDRYELAEELATGGMATVYLARVRGAVGFSRTVAMKRLHKQFARDAEFVAMFLDEARLASRVRHPNVVPTLDVVTWEGEIFLVMEYVHGESLAALRRSAEGRAEKLPVPIAVAIVADVLSGLHAAHEATDERGEALHIIHRDVSPQNVMVGADGVARVLDFGVSKAAGRLQTTSEGQVKGKAGYLAPEQLITPDVDRRVDVYAAGVVLWELLAGRRLYTADSNALVMAKVLSHDVPPLPAEVPAELARVVTHALEAQPAARFATAREMRDALEHAVKLATHFEVAEWMKQTMATELAERTEMLARVEQGGGSGVRLADLASPVHKSEEPTEATTLGKDVSPPQPAGRTRLLVSALALIVIVGSAAVFAFRAGARPEPGSSPVMAPSIAPSAQASPTISAAPTVDAAAPASVTASASTRPPVRPAAQPSAAATSTGAKKKCDPPYEFDADGHKHFKVECL